MRKVVFELARSERGSWQAATKKPPPYDDYSPFGTLILRDPQDLQIITASLTSVMEIRIIE